ncbi:MAG TPA: hypothetical protein VFV66_36130 [Nonomuraea sp.]|nr:hypothetical protein [Nonomuraea sp.]
MPWLTQVADVARCTGPPVVEVAGWQSRGHGPQPEVEGVVCHHTAGPAGGGDYPSLRVVRDGPPGLDGPLSHVGLGRSGTIYMISRAAAGTTRAVPPPRPPPAPTMGDGDHRGRAGLRLPRRSDAGTIGRTSWSWVTTSA